MATISKPVRDAVWMRDHETVKAICPVCKVNDITINTCQCGHAISVFNGGSNEQTNLKSICVQCNQEMGRKNIDDYIKEKYPSKEQLNERRLREFENAIEKKT